MGKQEQVFLSSEGDNWFYRNRSHIESDSNVHPDIDFIVRELDGAEFNFRNLLEVGCASGAKLEKLARAFDAKGFGVDPSSSAISRGLKRYPNLDLRQGLANELPFQDIKFSFVYFGFCLYLVTPEELEKVFLELRRVIENNGIIVITDFDAGIEIETPYKHYEGLTTFKRNYEVLIRNYLPATLIAKHSFSHSGNFFVSDRNERISTQIFFQES